MATKHSYLDDHYKKEGKGKVTFVEFTDIIVDDSILFPTSYGQPNDKGKITIEGKDFEIVDVWDDGDGIHLISHDTYPQDCKGKEILEFVDWDIRYNHMKFRTAMRVMAGLAFQKFGATHRINQTYEDYAWIDLEFSDITEEKIRELEEETNKYLAEGKRPEYYYISKQDFMKRDDLMKISKAKVPDLPQLRIVKLEGLPEQLEMGTLVKDTKEVGKVRLKTNLVKGKVGSRVNVYLE
ncbi:alanyl-tRNA editing protein [Cuniculiplasma sp. SKW3]|uniref:alanyl-tRNA editing protein n=1 Tax=Cuniculiplasma sp. SKW3 TaxID=3400170 RepID=UPI003FCF8496